MDSVEMLWWIYAGGATVSLGVMIFAGMKDSGNPPRGYDVLESAFISVFWPFVVSLSVFVLGVSIASYVFETVSGKKSS